MSESQMSETLSSKKNHLPWIKKWPFSISNTASVSPSVTFWNESSVYNVDVSTIPRFAVRRCVISLISEATLSVCLASKMTLYSLMR